MMQYTVGALSWNAFLISSAVKVLVVDLVLTAVAVDRVKVVVVAVAAVQTVAVVRAVPADQGEDKPPTPKGEAKVGHSF